MLILTIRTDKPAAEIGLFDSDIKLAYEVWEAHRQLAETIHTKVLEMLEAQHKGWLQLDAVAVYRGPGSFTGLRIGVAVANALAAAEQLPIVGEAEEAGWLERCLARLAKGENDRLVTPLYGAEVHITPQKK